MAKKSAEKTSDEPRKKAPKDGDRVNLDFGDKIRLGAAGHRVFITAGTLGIVSLAAAMLWGTSETKRFFHSYLVAYMWTLSIGLGALWWVTLQHLVNAKWSVVIRRIGELMAANMTLLAILALPIVVPAVFGNAELFPWADAEFMHSNHALHQKQPYLNVGFFVVRFIVYFAFWTWLARYLLIRSVRQDSGQDPAKSARSMRAVSAPAMIVIALTLTFASIDFLMSLNPMWFSTIFGIYYFAGCVLAVHSFFALVLLWLQGKGLLTKSVTQEHYHDIGKMMFAFTIFWSYIAFSQFMLIWYANIPEETHWYKLRFAGGWGTLSWVLLFGHFVLPFFGLLSRHVKRNRRGLAMAAVWILAIHWIDMYWLVMPNLPIDGPVFHVLDLLCLVGVAGLFIAALAYQARKVNLVPIKDPRIDKSLAFENI